MSRREERGDTGKMKNVQKILLSLSLMVLLVALGLTPFTVGENVPSDGLNDGDTEWATSGVVNLRGLLLPLGDRVTDSTGNTTSPYPVHNLNTSENFSSIQEAIDDSNTTDGNTIAVDPGNYTENVNVTKSLTIRSSSGNPADTIVNASDPDDHIFRVIADSVNISGFTIEGAMGDGEAGICLASSNNRITNNIFTSNYYGVISVNSNGNTLANRALDNCVEDDVCDYTPIHERDARFDEVRSVDGRDQNGTSMELSARDFVQWSLGDVPMLKHSEPSIFRLSHIKYSENGLVGSSGNSSNNAITDNNASLNFIGIALIGSTGNTIRNNHAKSNTDTGIYLESGSNKNMICNNSANSNTYGILLYLACNNNTVANNTANFNYYEGISIGSSNDNIITNNNASFTQVFSGICLWDSSNNNRINK